MTTVWVDNRWKDELKAISDENEVLREQAAQLQRQLEHRTEAVETVMEANDELEQQVQLRDKAIETVAKMQQEAKPMYKLTKMVLDIARGTKGTTAQRPVEQKQRRSSGFILDHYVDDLDQPGPTDEQRAENERRQARLRQHYGQLMKTMGRGSQFDQALRGEAAQGHPYEPGSPAQRLAYEAEVAERERRERTKPRRHLHSG